MNKKNLLIIGLLLVVIVLAYLAFFGKKQGSSQDAIKAEQNISTGGEAEVGGAIVSDEDLRKMDKVSQDKVLNSRVDSEANIERLTGIKSGDGAADDVKIDNGIVVGVETAPPVNDFAVINANNPVVAPDPESKTIGGAPSDLQAEIEALKARKQ